MGSTFSGVDEKELIAEIEICKTPSQLREYLARKSEVCLLGSLLQIVYDNLAGRMRVDLLQVINEYCDIRIFLERKIWYKDECELLYWFTHSKSLPFIAASNGWVDVVEYLLSLNIDINGFFGGEMTMLHAACYHDKIDVARVLLAYGADISIPCSLYDNSTPIMLAVSTKSLACFDELAIYGASLEGCYQKEKGDITIFLRLFDLLAFTDDDILDLGEPKRYSNPKSRTVQYYGEFEYLYVINKETRICDDNARVLKRYLDLLVLNGKWKTFLRCKNCFMRRDESNEKFFLAYIIPDDIKIDGEMGENTFGYVKIYTGEEEKEKETARVA